MLSSTPPTNTPATIRSSAPFSTPTVIPTATLPPSLPTPFVTRVTDLTPDPSPVRPTATPIFVVPSATPVTGGSSYTVQAGDTLYGIALRFDVSVDELAAVNNIDDPTLLQIGQVLTIPSTQQ